jgi:Protein of unknown function (DUF2894)
MSQPWLVGTSVPQLEAMPSLLSALESLRNEGAQRLDPARFHYLEALSRRMQAAPGDVRRLLEGKLNNALTDYGQRFRQAQSQTAASDHGGMQRPGASAVANAPGAPLAQLNRYIQTATLASADGGLGGAGELRPELKSAHRFREAWSRMCAEDQVDLAVGRGPENAGPLNSHLLVLRTLALMRSLSPDYLRRFLSHADSLLWLDQANNKHKQMATKAKPARPGRAKKK